MDSKTQVQAITPSTRSKVKVRPFWFPIWKCIDYQQGCGFPALAAEVAQIESNLKSCAKIKIGIRRHSVTGSLPVIRKGAMLRRIKDL
jgi:hypothetical protein